VVIIGDFSSRSIMPGQFVIRNKQRKTVFGDRLQLKTAQTPQNDM
jgi:hypothetical protein